MCSAICSCTNNDAILDGEKENQTEISVIQSKQAINENLSEFAQILSKVVSNNKDVRVFLKEESLKEFDKNTDVLYYLVRDEQIGDKTFREILIEASSEAQITKIEKTVPLLNIYNVRVDPLNVYPENLDVDDNEIPVAVSMPDSTYLYFNGAKYCGLAKGEVPGFNLFVVGQNSRINAKSISMVEDNNIRNKAGLKRATAKTVMFKSPEFDGRGQTLKKDVVAPTSILGSKATAAYYFFYKDDNSIQQKAYQRDYIYYGIRPDKMTGSLNASVSEYLVYIKINKYAYDKIARNKTEVEDPHLKTNEYSQKKHPLTDDELIEKFWTTGIYDFKFDIIKSSQSVATTVYIPLHPSDIWNFNIDYEETPATKLKHSKHTYKIDPLKFTSKDVYLEPIDLGKWHISNEAMSRKIIVYEEDVDKDVTDTETYVVQKAKSYNFNGNLKLNIGLKVEEILNVANLESSVSGALNDNTTTTETVSVTTHTKYGSDPLGSTDIYFYDPIITDKKLNDYSLKTYNAGYVTFGIVAK